MSGCSRSNKPLFRTLTPRTLAWKSLCSGYAQTVPRGGLVVPPVPPCLSLVFCLLRLRRAPRPGDCRCSSGSTPRAALGRQLDVQVGTRLRAEVVDVDRAAREARARCPHSDCEADVLVVRGQDVRLVPGAVHPPVDNRLRRRKRARAPGEVLADDPVAAAVRDVT